MSIDTKLAQHDLETTYKDPPLYGADASQLGNNIPNHWGNVMMDSLSFKHPTQPSTAGGWTPLAVSNAFPGINGFGSHPQQVVSPQDVESNDGSHSSLLSPTETNFSLQHNDSILNSAAPALSPSSPLPIRSQPKRQTRPTATKNDPPTTTTTATSPSPSGAALAASNRSERARKAANRRHSRAKESLPPSSSPTTRPTKTALDREKNRLAAAKCRGRKRAATDALDARYRAATAANTRMTQEHRELRDQLACWRMLALQHVGGLHGCRCQAIHRYNSDQAMKAVGDVEAGRRRGSFGYASVLGQGIAMEEGFGLGREGRGVLGE